MLQEYYLCTEALNSEYSVYDTPDNSTIRSGSSLILHAFNTLKNLSIKAINTAVSEAIWPLKPIHMSIATAFLSHSSKDKPLVEEVANALCQRGIVPWLNKNDLIVGSGLLESLQEAISKQISIILFLSEQSLASRWVQDELREAIQLEEKLEKERKDWVLPVYLDDPLKLVSSHPLLADRWLSAERDRVDKLGIYLPAPEGETLKSRAENIADKLSQGVYKLLHINALDDINIVVDQRGRGRRTGQYDLPPNIAKRDHPTLVFRPDTGAHNFSEMLVDREWNNFRQTMENSLSNALGTLLTERKIRILGDAQLGVAFFLGQYFDRTTSVSLYCYNIRHNTVFTNEDQERRRPLSGGNPNCETVAGEEAEYNEWLPAKINPGDRFKTVALYLGKLRNLPDVKDHLEADPNHPPLVFVQTEFFNTSEEVMTSVKDVIALLERLRPQNETTTIRLYCDLPFNVVPLLSANLINVINTVEFMEYRKDLQNLARPPQDMYVQLPMK